MGIILNKRGGVGMGATHPEPAPLSSLVSSRLFKLDSNVYKKKLSSNEVFNLPLSIPPCFFFRTINIF